MCGNTKSCEENYNNLNLGDVCSECYQKLSYIESIDKSFDCSMQNTAIKKMFDTVYFEAVFKLTGNKTLVIHQEI